MTFIFSCLRTLTGRKRSRPTEPELAVIRSLLTSSDPRHGQLVAQLERAPDIERVNPTPDTFRIAPTSTFDDLSFELAVDRIASDWLPVIDLLSGRELQFRVVVGRHGFLRGLEGRTMDGDPWPSAWEPAEASLAASSMALLELPSIAEQQRLQDHGRRKLEAWLDGPVPKNAVVTPPAFEPDSGPTVPVGGVLPRAFREFLSISNGLDAGPARIHGTADLYEINNTSLPLVAVAWDSDDTDDFIVGVSVDGRDEGVYRINVHGPEPHPIKIASDFREYLRERLLPG